MSARAKALRPLILFVVNHFLVGTHWFGIKRTLLNWAGLMIGEGTRVVAPIHIGSVACLAVGNDCWLGKNLLVDGNGSVTIGSNVDIGPQVTFATGGHEIGDARRRAGAGIVTHQVVGNGCWIGTHSVVVGSVEIGSGSVIAAGAVVTKSAGSNVLLGGVPAVEKKHLS